MKAVLPNVKQCIPHEAARKRGKCWIVSVRFMGDTLPLD